MALKRKRSSAGLREQVRQAVRAGDLQALEQLVSEDAHAVRHLVAMTHQLDDAIRLTACKGVGLAARFHPEMIESVIRRLIWSMNEESGANGLTAPQVLEAIARQRPEMILPVVPDMVRLSKDDNLHDGLADAICVVVHNLPGKVGEIMSKRLQKRIEEGKCCDD